VIDAPTTPAGWLAALAVLAVVAIAFFASGIWTIAIGAVLVAAVAYLIYVVGVNVHRYLTTRLDNRRP
jgi:membrane protein YdbS with pleckstrin-like domain